VFVTIPVQLSHERRQVFRHRGAGGVGEFGPQSGRKRLKELHRVEGDGGQMTHLHAPTDLPWPQPFGRAPYVVNTTEVLLFQRGGKIFAGNASTLIIWDYLAVLAQNASAAWAAPRAS
jgi:hypothetical protein